MFLPIFFLDCVAFYSFTRLLFYRSPGYILFWMMIWRNHVAKQNEKKTVCISWWFYFVSRHSHLKLSTIRLVCSHTDTSIDKVVLLSNLNIKAELIQFFAYKRHTPKVYICDFFFLSLYVCRLYRYSSVLKILRLFFFTLFSTVVSFAIQKYTWARAFYQKHIYNLMYHPFYFYFSLFIMIWFTLRFSVYVHFSFHKAATVTCMRTICYLSFFYSFFLLL